jgi:hypothetical protein
MLLLEFNRPTVGYWHDCGHAQIKENLGSSTIGCIWKRWRRACSVFTCMMSCFPDGTMPRRAAG